jgi:hypothetical protein
MTIGELAQTLGVTVKQILRCLYGIVWGDPIQSTITRLAPGCILGELAAVEQRIGHSLPPLHRYVLTLSNGGTLPYVNSMDYFAAALPREQEWNVLQLPPGIEDINDDPGLLPQKPLLLGKPFAETLLSVGIDPACFRVPDFDPASFIVMACGFFDADGFYCYHRADFGPIHAVGQPQYGVYVVAPDFEAFLRDQWLIFDASEEPMISRIQALL